VATPSASGILKIPGRICVNPTNLAGTYPFGGTALGTVRDVEFIPNVKTRPVVAEEWGGVPCEVVYAGEAAVLSIVFRTWDVDAIAALFLDTFSGATTARRVARGRATTDGVRAGALLSSKAAVVYYAPEADQHPGVLLYRAAPMLEPSQRVSFALTKETGIVAVWAALPDASGRTFAMGLRKDLNL